MRFFSKRLASGGNAADIQIQILEAASDSRIAAPTSASPRASLTRRRALTLSLATLLVGAAIAGLAAWTLKPSPPQPVSRFTITLLPGQRLSSLEQPTIALSPDGSQLVYAAVEGGTQQLYLRALDSLEARPIPGTEGFLMLKPNEQQAQTRHANPRGAEPV